MIAASKAEPEWYWRRAVDPVDLPAEGLLVAEQ